MSGECPKCFEHPVDCKCNDLQEKKSFEITLISLLPVMSTAICDKNIQKSEFKFIKSLILSTINFLEEGLEEKNG